MRWFDHWLKGIDTGVMDEPMLRVWMQDSVEPQPMYDVRPGRWVAEADVAVAAHRLAASGSCPLAEPRSSCSACSRAGREAGVWCAEGQSADLAGDQRPDDALSLTFDSEPLEEPLEILGFPEASSSWPSTGRRARRRPALRRLPGRHVGARHARASSTSPTARATSIPSRSSPAGATRFASRST